MIKEDLSLFLYVIAAYTLDLEKDPDRLMEDGQAAMGDKLKTTSGKYREFINLFYQSCPYLYMFDIYEYLLQFSDHDTLKNYEKLGGFTNCIKMVMYLMRRQ